MIKGINRQIIEIGETGNIYFERALLFVRPGAEDAKDHRLKTEARKMVENLSKPPKSKVYKKERKRLGKIGRITLPLFWSCFGATLFALVQHLFL